MKDNFEGYDEEKSTWQRIKKPLLAALFAIVIIACFCLYAQGTGLFPGQYMNKPCVEKYLRKNYGIECTVKCSGYDQLRARYVYDCSCDQGDFTMCAMHYSVKDDGYAKTFLKDETLSNQLESYVEGWMAEIWNDAETKLEFECSAYVTKGYGGDTDTETLLKNFGVSMTFEANLYGPRIGFEDYKLKSYKVLELLRSGLKVCPDFMQIFYTRTDGNVIQYESHLENEEFNYSESGYTGAKDVNFYVELTEKQQKDVKIYSIVQTAGFIVIAVTVVSLSALWIVRRYRKKSKRS